MDVGVGHLESGDHQPDSLTLDHRLLGLADSMGDRHEVARQIGIELGPLIDLGLRDHQGVPRV